MRDFNYVSLNPHEAKQYGMNGRVDLSGPRTMDVSPSFTPNAQIAFTQQEALKGHFTSNPLGDLYFSTKNIDALQEGIRYKIYKETNGQHVIGRQSEQDLRVIMRSVYLQNAKHLPCDFLSQVRTLNTKVLEWVVPEVLSNLRQYEVYKKDVSTLPMPMERGPLETTKGSKTLEMKPFFWFVIFSDLFLYLLQDEWSDWGR